MTAMNEAGKKSPEGIRKVLQHLQSLLYNADFTHLSVLRYNFLCIVEGKSLKFCYPRF